MSRCACRGACRGGAYAGLAVPVMPGRGCCVHEARRAPAPPPSLPRQPIPCALPALTRLLIPHFDGAPLGRCRRAAAALLLLCLLLVTLCFALAAAAALLAAACRLFALVPLLLLLLRGGAVGLTGMGGGGPGVDERQQGGRTCSRRAAQVPAGAVPRALLQAGSPTLAPPTEPTDSAWPAPLQRMIGPARGTPKGRTLVGAGRGNAAHAPFRAWLAAPPLPRCRSRPQAAATSCLQQGAGGAWPVRECSASARQPAAQAPCCMHGPPACMQVAPTPALHVPPASPPLTLACRHC